MAALAGYLGNIKIGAHQVALVTDTDFTGTQEMYDITSMGTGSAAKAFIPGLTEGTCKISLKFDYTDINGQVALWNAWLAGTLLTITLTPNGTNTISFSAYVKQMDIKTAVNKETTADVDLQPTGTISMV